MSSNQRLNFLTEFLLEDEDDSFNAIYACKHKSDTNSVCIDKQKEILKNVPRLQRGKNVSSIIKTQI